jgi:enamine deaminase RidA (YjgF/YER057c/UK114 family)
VITCSPDINHLADVPEARKPHHAGMTLTHLQPPGLLEVPGLTQMIVATGTRTVYISGQTPLTQDGQLIGEGDLRAQAGAVFRNLLTCLDAVGARIGDVVRTTMYIVDYDAAALDAIYTAAFEVFGDELPSATSTLVGVSALFHEGQRFEVDAIAVLD